MTRHYIDATERRDHHHGEDYTGYPLPAAARQSLAEDHAWMDGLRHASHTTTRGLCGATDVCRTCGRGMCEVDGPQRFEATQCLECHDRADKAAGQAREDREAW